MLINPDREWRKERLAALVKAKFDDNKTAFGKALGYDSGAYIRQMIKGTRSITEKTIAEIEALKGCAGWFSAADLGAAVAAPPPVREKFQDPERDTAWHVMDDLEALHPDDKKSWVAELRRQADKAREIGKAYVDRIADAEEGKKV
jgi:hypothetical protein